MDVLKIAQALGINLNEANAAKAQQAWQEAQRLGKNVHTKQDAINLLASKGIDKKALTKVGKFIDNPLAGIAAKMVGVNIDNIRKDFNSLLGSTEENNTMPSVKPSSKTTLLDKYRNGLKQL